MEGRFANRPYPTGAIAGSPLKPLCTGIPGPGRHHAKHPPGRRAPPGDPFALGVPHGATVAVKKVC